MDELRPEPLAKHVHHVVTEQEVDEGWQRLDASLRPERGWLRWWVPAALVAALVLVVGGVAWRSTRDEATVLQPGTAIATGEAGLSGVLDEGSRLDVSPTSAGRIEVASASEVRVRLDRGAVRFDVAKNPKRRFVVLAGRVEVRVVGTRFTVFREQAASVRVEQGVVEVWADGSQRAVLTAGQSWDEAVALAAPGEPAVGLPPAVELAEREERPAVTKSRPTRKMPPSKSKPGAPPAEAEEPLPAPLPSTVPALPEDPSSLFRVALDARRAGRAKEAAQALHAFIGRFPEDSRAGLALFELGRLEMDQLRLPSTAIETLERAIAKGPQSPYVEDAMARLVRLHHDLRHGPQCRAAKAAALERFPRGVYAATLDGLCSF